MDNNKRQKQKTDSRMHMTCCGYQMGWGGEEGKLDKGGPVVW